jgi:TolA-binding protein
MRVQESIGELEAELKALAAVENYDVELHFRIGRAYMETRRYREATEVFVYLHDQGDPKKAQEALYLAFLCAAHVQPLDRALKLGHDYMDEYPGGEYYDSLSLMLGQLYAKLEDWPQVVAVLTRALEASPKHESAAECMFLIGYASFMEEKFPDTITWLRRMNATFPGNPREADGTYWIGMALMFERQFDEAAVEFDAILNRFPDTPYLQDSAFRRAVCEFGSSRFREAEKMLELFVSQYPTNKLSGEAYMMLGDIGGVFGELTQGVERYQQVPRYDVNIEFYNYAMFRCGEMLNELNDFAGMVRHFKEYIARNREGSNLPLAMYWVGSALWSMGEQKGALEYFRQGIEKYGVDRKALGIDLILEEWVGRSRGAETGTTVNAWRDLADLLQKSEKEGQQTLGLRLKRIFLYEPEIPDERKRALLKELVQEKNLPLASPGVLELILDEAQKAGNRELAQKTADAVIRDFPETDTALTARRMLADYAIQKKDFATAIKHLNIIREVFATSGEAAEALMMLGDLYLKANQYAEADECYKSVLGVREWRGALWPAALYGRGECARMQRAFEQASAYYERIYLMYAQYRDWTARAYLARAQCLTQIMQYRKAAETLEEMLGNTELVNLPEAAQGRQLLNELKRRIL